MTAIVPVVHVECHRVPPPVALLEKVVGDAVAVLLEAAEGPIFFGGGVDEQGAVGVAKGHDGAEALHDVDAAPLEVEQVGQDGQASHEQPARRGCEVTLQGGPSASGHAQPFVDIEIRIAF